MEDFVKLNFKKFMNICSKCNQPVMFKQGIKKETGKPWSGYFCQNQECKNVDWTPKASSNPSPKAPQAPQSDVKPKDGYQVIFEQLQDFEERLMTYLKSKLS